MKKKEVNTCKLNQNILELNYTNSYAMRTFQRYFFLTKMNVYGNSTPYLLLEAESKKLDLPFASSPLKPTCWV